MSNKAYSFYFNASDWLSSPAVKQMSLAERGAYIGLLAFAWGSDRPGTLPANPDKVRRIAEMSAAEWEESGEILLDKFPLSECGTYRFNPRLLREVEKEEARSQKGRDAAAKRWQSTGNANPSQNDANPSLSGRVGNAQEQVQVKKEYTTDAGPSPAASGLPKAEPCPLTAKPGGRSQTGKGAAAEQGPDFDEFWQGYGKKEDRHKSEKAWRALPPAARLAALAALPGYIAATPERKFRKNPLTWLNGKCWQDEHTPAPLTPLLAPQAPALPFPDNPLSLWGDTTAEPQVRYQTGGTAPQPTSTYGLPRN